MPYDAEKLRRAIRRVQKAKGLKMDAWAKAAGKGERTLAEFLAGRGASPRVETIYAFADAAGVDPSELMGIDPPAMDISASAYRSMMSLLQRIERSRSDDDEALQAVRDLARSIEAQLKQ